MHKPFNSMRIVWTLAVSMLVFGGCVTPRAVDPYELREFLSTVPECSEESECKMKWEAAQLWVVQRSAFKIQIATDVIVETYNPPADSQNLGFRVTKEPVGNGRYKFNISALCNYLLGYCTVSPILAQVDFNRHINNVCISSTCGWIGVAPREMPSTTYEALGIDSGIVISEVAPGSPADLAGIESQDIILSINGQDGIYFADLARIVKNSPPGTEIRLAVHRQGQRRQIAVIVGPMPR